MPAWASMYPKMSLDVVLQQAQREHARTCANTPTGFREVQRWLLAHGVTPQRTQVA